MPVAERAEDNQFKRASLTDKEFRRLGDFVHSEVGIKMPDIKKTMLEARLQKRLKALGFDTFNQYIEYVFSPKGRDAEIINFIDVVTTNKTDFFREPNHFEYLTSTALPTLIRTHGAGVRRKLMVWSAGCSTGEEPYTLTMVLDNYGLKQYNGVFSFTLIATDISSRVLEKAQSGVYEEEKVAPIPMEMKKRYLLRSKDRSKKIVKIVPELRSMIKFRRLNFMEGDFGFREEMDIIFCRNVVIYFDKQTQEKLLNKFSRYLIPGGYLFMGHSETIAGLKVPFVQVAPTVYRVAH
ncbi:CheR family methyltransferase [Candidatus Magnetomonas plexicatena]|uniref:CheR family methyltransferase n=1 Tax=Candidatus Magnetomonas plexicatena TaxID=2552947 RepID=UPI001C77BE2B|nr:protein-glutamate O-methyltransferase [Nitrospirales bacterium LBB_01]